MVLFWLFSCNKSGNKQAPANQQKSEVNTEKTKSVTVPGGNNEKDEVYLIADEMPEFKGGDENIPQFIITNVKYPLTAMSKGIQGKVFVSFVIDEKGKVTDVKVKRSVNPELDAEAVRVISAMPDWKPGKNKGKPVKVTYTMPINFKLN